ncbi:hypothetical protein BST81_10510 [Leptolyngbya sp. 'hensonii']|uniref:ExbD/TolR family protein n=1 Tax=Leptolyngbya sp. 'hensonii' TaxID=1922337 RepID=UPI00094FDABF|nr:biopolymer transporter ExbD [Leptolyngbya sp. 'hensonii']OLP18503.1 hypothetical protein BST81_10510 [Leptolyngbya sp. 'hensonii']
MKINLDTPGEEVQIQIVPLIDVIFCILTFFILASLQLTREQAAIRVNVPTAGTGDRQELDRRLVTIDPAGQIYLDGSPLNQEQLKQQLVGYYQLNPNGMVVVNADKDVRYDSVLQIFDLIRAIGGGDRVALGVVPGAPNQTVPISPSVVPNPYGTPTSPYNPYTPPATSSPLVPLPGSSPTPGSLFNPSPTAAPIPGGATVPSPRSAF